MEILSVIAFRRTDIVVQSRLLLEIMGDDIGNLLPFGSCLINNRRVIPFKESGIGFVKQTECLLQAHNGKPSELQLLDAPVSHITFTIYDGEFISLHGNYDYPSSCNGLFSMIEAEMQRVLDNEIQSEDIITITED